MSSGTDSDFFSDGATQGLLSGENKRETPKHWRIWALCCAMVFVIAVAGGSAAVWQVYLRPAICARTPQFPNKNGCPTATECARLRGLSGRLGALGMHRVHVGWRLGAMYGLHSHKRVMKMSDNRLRARFGFIGDTAGTTGTHAAGAGIPKFLRSYSALEDALEDGASRPGVRSRLRRYLQVELKPLCCIKRTELDLVRKAVSEWAQNSTASTPGVVHFGQLKCYHERTNSVNNVVLADSATARKLAVLDAYLRRKVIDAGVGLLNLTSLPYHLSVVDFHTDRHLLIRPFVEQLAWSAKKLKSGVWLTLDLRGVVEKAMITSISRLNDWRYST